MGNVGILSEIVWMKSRLSFWKNLKATALPLIKSSLNTEYRVLMQVDKEVGFTSLIMSMVMRSFPSSKKST